MQDTKEIIRSKGLKVTHARICFYETLLKNPSPLDISTIFEKLKKANISVDQVTVYRIAENFVKKGLIKRLQFGENKFMYEVIGSEHHHAICENCGKVEDITKCNISRVEKDIELKKGFKVSRHSLEFYGFCQSCL